MDKEKAHFIVGYVMGKLGITYDDYLDCCAGWCGPAMLARFDQALREAHELAEHSTGSEGR